MIFFSNKIEKFIPPKKGKSHILRIIRELINIEPTNKGTNIELALKYLTNIIKKKSITFLISDFKDNNSYSDAMKIANRKHDVVALRINDVHENKLPDVGLIKLKDNETGKVMWVDTSDKSFQKKMEVNHLKFEAQIKDVFTKSGVDFTTINTHEGYIKPLMTLFKKR